VEEVRRVERQEKLVRVYRIERVVLGKGDGDGGEGLGLGGEGKGQG